MNPTPTTIERPKTISNGQYKKITFTEVLITPKIAEDYLKHNVINRKLTIGHVDFLADQMIRGQWQFSGDPIKFNVDGELMDKQHTLHAIIKSGVSQKMIVVRNLPKSVMTTLDTGRIRTASDVLSMNNILYSASTSAITKMIMNYKHNKSKAVFNNSSSSYNRLKITNADILDFAIKNNISDYATYGFPLAKTKILTGSIYGFLFYLFSKIDMNDSKLFLESLSSGENLKAGSPILYLRNKMIESNSANLRMTAGTKMVMIFKAWNLFREKKSCKSIKVLSTEDLPKLI